MCMYINKSVYLSISIYIYLDVCGRELDDGIWVFRERSTPFKLTCHVECRRQDQKWGTFLILCIFIPVHVGKAWNAISHFGTSFSHCLLMCISYAQQVFDNVFDMEWKGHRIHSLQDMVKQGNSKTGLHV